MMFRWIVAIHLIFGAFVVGWVILATKARAHSFYSIICCSNKDCAPVPDGTIKASAMGWVVPGYGTIPFNSSKIQESPDGHFHMCVLPSHKTDPLRCLYIPPQSY